MLRVWNCLNYVWPDNSCVPFGGIKMEPLLSSWSPGWRRYDCQVLARGGEYMQSIDGRPKQLLMSQNNAGRRDIWLGEKPSGAHMSPWHNPRAAYEHMHACFQWIILQAQKQQQFISSLVRKRCNWPMTDQVKPGVQLVFPLTSFQLFDCSFKPPSNCVDTSSSCVIKDRRLITRSIVMCNFVVSTNQSNLIEDPPMQWWELAEREILDSLTSTSGKCVTEEN